MFLRKKAYLVSSVAGRFKYHRSYTFHGPDPQILLSDLSFGTDFVSLQKNETGASQPFIQFSKIFQSSPQFLTAA